MGQRQKQQWEEKKEERKNVAENGSTFVCMPLLAGVYLPSLVCFLPCIVPRDLRCHESGLFSRLERLSGN